MEAIEPTHLFAESGRDALGLPDWMGTAEPLNPPIVRHSSASGDVYWSRVEAVPRPEPTAPGTFYSNASLLDPLTGREVSAAPSPVGQGRSLAFVDARVEDVATLVAGLAPGVEVAILDPNRDGMAQMSEILAGREGIASIHIISHGSVGRVQLGATTLSLSALQDYQAQLQSWGNALTKEADILFYGCNLASSPEGVQFVKEIAALTGADVAASDDLTGNRALGGDWDLEVFTGSIESDLALQVWARSAYGAVFDTVTDLQVSAASYFGSAGDDAGNAVEIAPDNTILLAGTVGSQGQVLRLDATGQTVLASYAVGTNIQDMDINRSNGNITVVGDSGATTLSSDGSVLWTVTLSGSTNTRRVAVAQDGTVALLESNNSGNHQVTVLSAAGTQLGSFAINQTGQETSVDDIAIDSNAGSVFVAGYRQVASNLQLPLFRSYDYAGSVKWSNYEFSAAQAVSKGDTADTRGLRLAMGRDGMLYYAGSLDGGTTVYRRNSQDINLNATYNVNIDNYTNTSNTNVGKYGYFARVNPATGEVLKGQYVVNRLSSGKGNSFGINAIAADESGQVFIGGSSAASVPDRAQLKINGASVGNYTSGEGAVIAISPDFTSRELVAVWTGNGTGAASGVNGIAAANGVRAIASTVSGSMMTANPVRASLAGGKDIYFSVWGNTTLPAISITDVTVTEGDAGMLNAEFSVSLSQAPTGNVTFDFTTAEGTATAGSDYVAQTGTLTFTPGGSLSQKISIAIAGDAIFEANETFFVNLSNVSSNATIADNQGVATLLNDDSKPPTDISLSNNSVAENSTSHTVVGLLSTTDADATDTHTYTLLDNAGGRFQLAGNQLQVADGTLLDFESNSSHSITVRSTDASGLFFDKTFVLNVGNVNETPTTTGLTDLNIPDPTAVPSTTIDVASVFRDRDAGDTLTYSITGNTNPNLFSSSPTIDPATGELTLNYNSTALGTSEIALRGTDAAGLFVETTFKVNVGTPNRAPVANPDEITTTAGQPIAFSLDSWLANDRDPDGDSLTITAWTLPNNGTLVDNGDGTLTYTPKENFTGSDALTYTLRDRKGKTTTGTVNFTINPAVIPTPNPTPITEPNPAAESTPVTSPKPTTHSSQNPNSLAPTPTPNRVLPKDSPATIPNFQSQTILDEVSPQDTRAQNSNPFGNSVNPNSFLIQNPESTSESVDGISNAIAPLSASTVSFSPLPSLSKLSSTPASTTTANNLRKRQLYDFLANLSRPGSTLNGEILQNPSARGNLPANEAQTPSNLNGSSFGSVLPNIPTDRGSFYPSYPSYRLVPFQSNLGDLFARVASQLSRASLNHSQLEFLAAATVLISLFVGNYNYNQKLLPQMELKSKKLNERRPDWLVRLQEFAILSRTEEEFQGWNFSESEDSDPFGLDNPEQSLFHQATWSI